MGAPNAKMKISKKGITFEESVDRANYLIDELTRAALRDVAKYVLKEVRRKVRGINPYIKKAKNAVYRYDKYIPKGEQVLYLGIENPHFGAESAWWADQAELGTANQPKRGFLTSTVQDNIEQIRKIEAQYLSAIEDDIAAAQMCDEAATEFNEAE